MTIEKARELYGLKESNGNYKTGYVLCDNCPIDGRYSDRYCPNGCKGYTDAYKAIVRYVNDGNIPDPTAANDTDTPNDIINHPSHYCRDGGMESIEEMVLVFGKEAVKNFCLCNVWKYRYRSSSKNGEEDLKKSDWYMRKFRELSNE